MRELVLTAITAVYGVGCVWGYFWIKDFLWNERHPMYSSRHSFPGSSYELTDGTFLAVFYCPAWPLLLIGLPVYARTKRRGVLWQLTPARFRDQDPDA